MATSQKVWLNIHVILHYTYWLTWNHSGNFRDVPLIEVSIEDGSAIKHCRKRRKTITFAVNAQEKKAKERTLIKLLKQPNKGKDSSNYTHRATNPYPRGVIILESQEHVQVTLRHASRDTNQTPFTQTLLSPNALTLAPNTNANRIFISPSNEPANLHTKNHATSNQPSCLLILPHASASTIKRKISYAKCAA